MAKQKDKDLIPYVTLGTDQNLCFYEQYDEHFLFNKVVTFLYILDNGEPVITQVEENLIAHGGARLSNKYLESIRAEILFTTLHQCEAFFALLIAPFQPLSHWLYLTTYETKEIKEGIRKILDNKIEDITNGSITDIQDFIKVTIYSEVMSTDLQLANRWNENIDNVAWLLKHIGEFFFKYEDAYNSYKHGLRIMTGPHQVSIGLENADGTVSGPMHVIQAAEDSVTYLHKEPIREVEGKKERPISEVTKAFNPSEAFFYLAKMSQMLETIKATRLMWLKGGGTVERINTFFQLDRDAVLGLAKYDEWKQGPMRTDEARVYSQFIAQMRAYAEKQTDSTNLEDHLKPNAR